MYLFFSTPFNESTYIGWASTFCLQMACGLAFVVVNLSTVTFVIAIGLYFAACTKHFRITFSDFSQIASKNATIKMKMKTKKSIITAVNFHRTTKGYGYGSTIFILSTINLSSMYYFWIFLYFSSIFELSRIILNATICFQLFMNVVFMSITFFDLEMVSSLLLYFMIG